MLHAQCVVSLPVAARHLHLCSRYIDIVFLVAAIAAHGIMSASFPWLQGKFDMMLGKQLMAVSAEDKKKAAGIAAPIAAKLLKER